MNSEEFKTAVEKAAYLCKLGRHKEADKEYTQIIDSCHLLKQEVIDGKSSEHLALMYNNRGHVRYLQVEFDTAVEDFTEALLLQPDLSAARYGRGLIHYRLGRYTAAVTDMESVLAIDPNFTDARHCLDQAIQDREEQQTRLPSQTTSSPVSPT